MDESDLVAEFHQRLTRFAAEPSRIALHNRGSRTYAQLMERIAWWQESLDKRSRVAFQLPNSFDWAALDLALLFSGKVGVPVPEFFSTAQVQHLLDESGADTLITTTEAPDALRLSSEARTAPLFLHDLSAAPSVSLHPGTAKVTFTSGSTGNPKGVCLDGQTLLQTARSLTEVLRPEGIGRHLAVLPLSLLLENVAGLYANLWNGSEITLVAMSELGLGGSSAMDPLAFAQAQCLHEPHSIIIVPEQLLALVALAEAGVDLPASYRFIAVGGARVAPDLLKRAHAQGLPAYEGYGLTECGSVVALNTPAAARTGSAGKILPHVELAIVAGEAVVRTPRMLGYVGKPAHCGAIHTGDSATLEPIGPCGGRFLDLNGRLDNRMITSFGRNLSPEWLESELQTELPIALACALGDELPANVALLVARDNCSADDVRLAVERCNLRLPDYARISHIRVLPRAQLVEAGAISPLGKLRRVVLLDAFADEIANLKQLARADHKEPLSPPRQNQL